MKNLKELGIICSPSSFEFPKNMYKLKLKTLFVSCNLKKLPTEISMIRSLKILKIINNDIKDFSGIKKLQNLKALIIENNNLEKIPKDILKLKKIEKIDLSWNEINVVNEEDSKLLIYFDSMSSEGIKYINWNNPFIIDTNDESVLNYLREHNIKFLQLERSDLNGIFI